MIDLKTLQPISADSSTSRSLRGRVVFWLLVALRLMWFVDPAVAQEADLQSKPRAAVCFKESESGIEVYVDEQLFTHLRIKSVPKPFCHPVFAPGQIPMTRNWPMEEHPQEPKDHPHHRSLWVGHIINGVDFWTEAEGSVIVEKVEPNSKDATLTVQSTWRAAKDGQVVCKDTTVYRFGVSDQARWIDIQIVFWPIDQAIEFEDTKEGTFAVRTHPNLQLTPAKELEPDAPQGQARNSEGEKGASIWGKRARWVVYTGAIDQQDVAIALFDHPNNLRHPTTWHARDYGLVAANPFGLHEFLGRPLGEGNFIVNQGDQLILKYRSLFIKGHPSDEELEAMYAEFAGTADTKKQP